MPNRPMRSRSGIFTQEMPAFSDKKGEVQDMKKADIEVEVIMKVQLLRLEAIDSLYKIKVYSGFQKHQIPLGR